MKALINYLRVDEWLNSKVTMTVAVAAYFICVNQRDVAAASVELLVYFIFLCMFLAISYVANDFSDIEIDRKAGKKKVIANMPKAAVWISLILMGIIGVVPIMLYVENKILGALLILITVFLGVAYSAPGIRFKERGFLGILECSFAQRCMPVVLLWLFLDLNAKNIFLWTLWFLISFLDGLRYILIHQYIDQDNDRETGVHTYVSDTRPNIRRNIIWILSVEIGLCILLLIPLIRVHTWIVIIGILVTLILEFCIYKTLYVYAGKDWLVSFDSVPLEAFLNIILPVMLGICMMKTNLLAGLFVVIIIICSYKLLKTKIDISMVYIKSKL